MQHKNGRHLQQKEKKHKKPLNKSFGDNWTAFFIEFFFLPSKKKKHHPISSNNSHMFLPLSQWVEGMEVSDEDVVEVSPTAMCDDESLEDTTGVVGVCLKDVERAVCRSTGLRAEQVAEYQSVQDAMRTMNRDTEMRTRLGAVVGSALLCLGDMLHDAPYVFPRTPFDVHRNEPHMSPRQQAMHIARTVSMSSEALCLALLYLDMILEERLCVVSPRNLSRLFGLCFVAASKYAYDRVYSNRIYARALGIDVDTLNYLEIQLYQVFQFDICANPERWHLYTGLLTAGALMLSDSEIVAEIFVPSPSPESSTSPANCETYPIKREKTQTTLTKSEPTRLLS